MTRIELENKLVTEIHYLPIEAIETMLKLAVLIKPEFELSLMKAKATNRAGADSKKVS